MDNQRRLQLWGEWLNEGRNSSKGKYRNTLNGEEKAYIEHLDNRITTTLNAIMDEQEKANDKGKVWVKQDQYK